MEVCALSPESARQALGAWQRRSIAGPTPDLLTSESMLISPGEPRACYWWRGRPSCSSQSLPTASPSLPAVETGLGTVLPGCLSFPRSHRHFPTRVSSASIRPRPRTLVSGLASDETQTKIMCLLREQIQKIHKIARVGGDSAREEFLPGVVLHVMSSDRTRAGLLVPTFGR